MPEEAGQPESPSRHAHASDGYGVIDPSISAPALPGEVIALAELDDLIDRLAADMVVHGENCVRRFGDFHLALSGGSTPQPLYERLMVDPNYRRLPWRRTHLWIVDERCVGDDDPLSNFRAIRETIVEHADIPPAQVHPMPVLAERGDAMYEAQLQEALGWREKGHDRLDFVLLGMGTDGHTASLFPNSSALVERRRLIVFNTHEAAKPPRRMTMTYPLINSARFVAVMVTGAAKAPVLARVAARHGSVEDMPITGIRPATGELKWYLDAAACGNARG